jgi:phytoene dehydrogenase-like protein
MKTGTKTAMQRGNRVVVIGSGFGGLAAAIRLQARGYQVTLLEQRDQPGGRAYVYRDAGYVFDAGPTVVTAPYLIEELFSLCGRKMADYLQLLPVSPFYRVRFHDGRYFEYSGNTEQMLEQIRAWQSARCRWLPPLHRRVRAHLPGRLRAAWGRAVSSPDRHAQDRAPDAQAAVAPVGVLAGQPLHQAP